MMREKPMIEWYLRDASWYNFPETKTPKKYHRSDQNGMAYCNRKMPLNEDTGQGEVDEKIKCKKCYFEGVRNEYNR